MKIHHFLIDDIYSEKQKGIITKINLVHQIKNVLKLKPQEKIILLDGKGKKAEVTIEKINSHEIGFLVNKVMQIPKANYLVILYCSLLKKENFEWMVQKATELGAAKIVPLICERTVKTKIDNNRLKKIIQEAVEQCERAYLPEFKSIISFKDVLTEKKDDEIYLFFDKEGEKINTFSKNIFHKKIVHIFVGPEGGWTQQEKNFAKENNFLEVSINENILRAETAALSAITLTSYFLN